MDEGFAVCEHGGRLIYQHPSNQQKIRQFLSQNDVTTYPTITVPKSQKREEKKEYPKEVATASKKNVFDHIRLLRYALNLARVYASTPYDLWSPSKASAQGQTTSPITRISCHPTHKILAILNRENVIQLYSLPGTKFLKLSVELGDIGDVIAFHWNAQRDIVLATADGELLTISFDFIASSHSRMRYSLLKALLPRPSLRFCDWINKGHRFFICGGERGAWIYDTFERNAVRLTSSDALGVATAEQYIAIVTPGSLEITSYHANILLSQTTVLPMSIRRDVLAQFANDRVLLLSNAGIVQAFQLSITSREPLVRNLQSFSITPEMSENQEDQKSGPPTLTVSKFRILASIDGYSSLIYIDIDTNQILYRRIGAVNGHPGQSLLYANAIPDIGFSCLWSDGSITILPIL